MNMSLHLWILANSEISQVFDKLLKYPRKLQFSLIFGWPLNFFIITNLIHKFLVHSHKLSPSLAVAQDGHLQRVTIPEAAYVQFASLIS